MKLRFFAILLSSVMSAGVAVSAPKDRPEKPHPEEEYKSQDTKDKEAVDRHAAEVGSNIVSEVSVYLGKLAGADSKILANLMRARTYEVKADAESGVASNADAINFGELAEKLSKNAKALEAKPDGQRSALVKAAIHYLTHLSHRYSGSDETLIDATGAALKSFRESVDMVDPASSYSPDTIKSYVDFMTAFNAKAQEMEKSDSWTDAQIYRETKKGILRLDGKQLDQEIKSEKNCKKG